MPSTPNGPIRDWRIRCCSARRGPMRLARRPSGEAKGIMRALILLHRWLGVAFCLLFAMWFATGIVMHFVPFPALTEADRFAGLAPIDLASIKHGPAEAIGACAIGGTVRCLL